MSSAGMSADATGLGDEEVLTPQMLAATRKAPSRRGRQRVRPWYMSVVLHGSLIVATIIAIFPVFWIAISSLTRGKRSSAASRSTSSRTTGRCRTTAR